MDFLPRTLEPVLRDAAAHYPVVTVTGPRQSGKTTLCRRVFPEKAYVSLENMDTRIFAREDPRGFLAGLPDGAILDEIQQTPELPSYIQTLVDEKGQNGLFVLTGSQQFEVATTISQSLAGRTAVLKLLPFSIEELGQYHEDRSLDQLMLMGFYPRIWKEDLSPSQALANYLETYVERDIRQLVAVRNLSLFQRFVILCAGRVGQLLNLSNLAADCGISHQTARNWLTLLEASYIVFRLPPYFANMNKRLVKSPKLYFYDVGLAAHLIGLENDRQVSRDPLRGSLFENLVVMEALKYRLHRGRRSNLHFFRDSNGNEIDILCQYGTDFFPVEIKAGMTVNRDFFKGIRTFARIFDLPLGAGLVYGGEEHQNRGSTTVSPARKFHRLLESKEGLTGSGGA